MTMQVIQHIELGSAQASVTFSSIPQTYTDLVVFYSARGTSGQASFLYRLNGATSGYSSRYLGGNGSSAFSASATTLTSTNAGGAWGRLFENAQDASSTANTFSNAQIYIPNYTSTTNKSISGDLVSENNATTAHQNISAGLVTVTNAVTEVAFALFEGNFAAGSSATLYGITKGSDGTTTVS